MDKSKKRGHRKTAFSFVVWKLVCVTWTHEDMEACTCHLNARGSDNVSHPFDGLAGNGPDLACGRGHAPEERVAQRRSSCESNTLL